MMILVKQGIEAKTSDISLSFGLVGRVGTSSYQSQLKTVGI